jgi:ribosomal protein L37AE/L43A
MQIDPVQEWQRLTAEYRQKFDNELLELARDYADLTQPAQQALRAEMLSRGMGDPENPKSVRALQSAPREPTQPPLALKNAPWAGDSDEIAFGAHAPEPVPDTPDTGDEDDGPHDYTWKTPLCECETSQQARELVDALRQAGIDSWVDGPGSSSRYRSSGLANPRVLVAADQLDQARAIAAQPIPQEIVEEEKEEAQEFVEPKCPRCGSDDVVLEGVDPENTWRCEQCDEQWTENLPKTEGEAPAARNTL